MARATFQPLFALFAEGSLHCFQTAQYPRRPLHPLFPLMGTFSPTLQVHLQLYQGLIQRQN